MAREFINTHPTLTRRRSSNLGFTILELAVYCVILTVAGIPLLSVTLTVSRSSAEGSMHSRIQERNRVLLRRFADEYTLALAGTTNVSADGKVIRFTSNGGFDGSASIPGPAIRYEIRLDASEAANGRDDNKNGLVDEALLVRVNEGSGQEVVLASSLSYQRSFLALTGTGVTVTINSFGFSYGTGKVSQVQSALTVYPQN